MNQLKSGFFRIKGWMEKRCNFIWNKKAVATVFDNTPQNDL